MTDKHPPYHFKELSPNFMKRLTDLFINPQMIDALKQTQGDIRDTLSKLIASKSPARHFVDESILHSQARQLLEAYGEIRIIRPEDGYHKVLTETIAEYNRVHPAAQLAEPRLVVSIENAPTPMYLGGLDMLAVNKRLLKMPVNQQKALTGHELAHADDRKNNAMKFAMYDRMLHAQTVAPNLYKACSMGVLPDAWVEKLLPSPIASVFISPKMPYHIKNAIHTYGNLSHWINNPISASSANLIHALSSDCQTEVKKVWDDFDRAQQQTLTANLALSRQNELDADRKSSQLTTVGNQSIADALLTIGARAAEKLSEEELTHPHFKTRLKELACKVKPPHQEVLIHDDIECEGPKKLPLLFGPKRGGTGELPPR